MIVHILAATAAYTALGQIPVEEPASGPTPSAVAHAESSSVADGTRRLLILCGHPGDDEHRVLYVETVDRLQETLTARYGFDAGAATVLFGTDEMLSDGGPAPVGASAACSRDNFDALTAQLHATLQPDDTLWVIVLGHSHFDGQHSWFNLSGPDIEEEAFARSFEGLTCREMVFWITIPASGFYVRPLSADGRIIITATEADREINETIFPHVLADVLAEPPSDDEWDGDRDGRSTLLDLYVTVTRHVAQTYLDDNALSTEHARLEDNGDGRGSEVQRGYLPEELGGRLREGESPRIRTGTEDGAAAANVEFARPADPSQSPDSAVPVDSAE